MAGGSVDSVVIMVEIPQGCRRAGAAASVDATLRPGGRNAAGRPYRRFQGGPRTRGPWRTRRRRRLCYPRAGGGQSVIHWETRSVSNIH